MVQWLARLPGKQEIRGLIPGRGVTNFREARWPSGRASDSRVRGLGFDPHSGRLVVSLSMIHLPPKKYW